MTVSWKAWPNLSCLCLFLCAAGALSQEFQLQPLNLTVLRGSPVTFNATVGGRWEFMTWNVGGLLALTVPFADNFTSSGQFSAGLCSGGDTGCVEFTIHNVTRKEAGEVVCSVQGPYGSKVAQLYVQEVGAVSIVGGNVTVVQDQQVEFQCETSAWYPIPSVSWTRNGEVVNSSLYNTTTVSDGDSFNSTSVLTFQAVSSTTVKCLATVSELRDPESSSVSVVVVPKPPDWTVLIAVVSSIGGAALLVLLILGIIFCYKRRKEKQPNYQDEVSKRVRTQSQLSGVNAAGQRKGQVNAGYLPEGQTSVAPSELTDSGIFEAHDVVNSAHAGNGYSSANSSVDASGPKKHRHVTIV